MDNDNLTQLLQGVDKDPDKVLVKQRNAIMAAVRRHQHVHKWVIRTLSTLFFAIAIGGGLLAILTQKESLLISVVLWLVLGAFLLLRSHLKLLELKLDETLALLDSSKDDDGD